jgi:phage terminase large subunit-like protein
MTEFSVKDHHAVLQELERRKLDLYRPYPKQLMFHNAGITYRERLLRAGNQMGKTMAAAAEVAIHATGRYPLWWNGRRFNKAPVIWCAGVTGEVVRDSIQRLLIGDVANPGTGFIPPDDIIETVPSRGVAGLVDTLLVNHINGGKTRIRLKYYEQGREKFQADTVDVVWLDEEPDLDIYTEALTRTNATRGMVYLTFTPLKGMSEVVRRFLKTTSPDRFEINMTIDDALHIAKTDRQKIIDSYPAHEKEARIYGTPSLGGGRIFPISEEAIACDAIPLERIPMHWQVLGGLDFGWDHPTAAVKLLYDPENDVVYITNTYRLREATPVIHSAALKSWGDVFFAWPHDGLQHDKGSGEQLAQIYRDQGLKLLSEHAMFPDGTNGVEAGLAEMLIRMETGRLKIYRHLIEWFEEFRLYHRTDGKVVKEYDDILCATRYALMCIRFATFIYKPKEYVNNQHTSSYDACSVSRFKQEIGLGQRKIDVQNTYEWSPDFRRLQ